MLCYLLLNSVTCQGPVGALVVSQAQKRWIAEPLRLKEIPCQNQQTLEPASSLTPADSLRT